MKQEKIVKHRYLALWLMIGVVWDVVLDKMGLGIDLACYWSGN